MIRTAAALALLLVACASAEPEGTYEVQSYLQTGNCPASEGRTFQMRVTRAGVTGYVIGFEGVSGTCPLEVQDDGRYRAACDVRANDGTAGRSELVLDFNGDGFEGDTSENLKGPSGCVGTYKLVGTRK